MSSSDSPTIHRSISMPAKPQPLQTKPIKRSQEKETLIEQDYYPESPTFDRRQISFDADNRERLGSATSQSANNFLTTEWAGSTVELNNDLRRNEADNFYYHRKPNRVIEKNGRENVTFKRIPEKSWRYIRDFVTTLVRWILPQRFLTYYNSSATTTTKASVTVTTVNNNTPQPLSASDEQDSKQLNDNDDNDEHNIGNSCNDKLDTNQENKRVTFSLFD